MIASSSRVGSFHSANEMLLLQSRKEVCAVTAPVGREERNWSELEEQSVVDRLASRVRLLLAFTSSACRVFEVLLSIDVP